MHDITPPLNLVHRLGWSRLFHDISSLLSFMAQNGIRISSHHVGRNSEPSTCNLHDWIVRDSQGRVVSADHLFVRLPSCMSKRRRLAVLAARHAASLGMPIPGTGRESRPWLLFRRPVLLAIARQRDVEADLDREQRPRKKLVKPDELWDRWEASGIPRSDVRDRNWKRHRAKQWKA